MSPKGHHSRRRNPENYLFDRAQAIEWIEAHPEAVPELMQFGEQEQKISEQYRRIYDKVLWSRLGKRPPYPLRRGKNFDRLVEKRDQWEEARKQLSKHVYRVREQAIERMSRDFRKRYGFTLEVFNHLRGIVSGLVRYDYGSEPRRVDLVVLNWAEKQLNNRSHTVMTGPTASGKSLVIVLMSPAYAKQKGFLT